MTRRRRDSTNVKGLRKLIVMADYCHGLFLPDGATSPELLRLPPDLCVRFDEWLRLYREPDQVPADYDRAGYNAQGRCIAEDVAVVLQDSHQIVYRYLLPLKQPNDEWEWDAEHITESPVFEITISAGHAPSVWKVGGGLQPRLEDLHVPPQFAAKLEAWNGKYDATCGKPSYSRRREHDAAGRAIAEELQQAVGEGNIHVLFRHWADFEPKGWRSRWREENLFTLKVKDFWLEEDLPDELVTRVLRIFPDFAEAYLWDLDGGSLGVEDVGGTAELDDRFRKWSAVWEAHLDVKTATLDRNALAAQRFDEKGLSLAAELKRVVGGKARVIYHFILEEAHAEILAGGRTAELPRETDCRQWALDQRQE